MKKAQIKKSVSALAMAAVIAVSLFGYGAVQSLPLPVLTRVCPVTSPALPRASAATFPSP